MRWSAVVPTAVARLWERPILIPVALAGFLVRGGVILFSAPILVFPTPIGVGNFIGANAISPTGIAPALVALIFGVAAALVLGLLVGTYLGVRLDIAQIAIALDRDRDGGPPSVETAVELTKRSADGTGATLRSSGVQWPVAAAVAVRLLCLAPVVLAVIMAVPPIVDAGYDELVLPTDVVRPYLIRVFDAAAPAIVLVGLVWLLSELVGGIAVRFVVLASERPLRALGSAVWRLIRHPLTSLLMLVSGLLALGLAVLPSVVALGHGWRAVNVAAAPPTELATLVVSVLLLVGIWLGSLILVGLASAWRGVLWTIEIARPTALSASWTGV